MKMDPKRCQETVNTGSYIYPMAQCSRKCGYGPKGMYCKQHAKIKNLATLLCNGGMDE